VIGSQCRSAFERPTHLEVFHLPFTLLISLLLHAIVTLARPATVWSGVQTAEKYARLVNEHNWKRAILAILHLIRCLTGYQRGTSQRISVIRSFLRTPVTWRAAACSTDCHFLITPDNLSSLSTFSHQLSIIDRPIPGISVSAKNETRTKLASSETKTRHFGQFRHKTKLKLVRIQKKRENLGRKSENKMSSNSNYFSSLPNYHGRIPLWTPWNSQAIWYDGST
jgi:hypothetical protein